MPNLTVQQIKDTIVEFHGDRGYRLFEPFPLVSTDPTVLFVNATITPFKTWFTSNTTCPEDYALIQGCLRMGGANELDLVGINPYYFTFFEMFGSGMFRADHEEAVAYLLDFLMAFGISEDRLYFTTPIEGKFQRALKRNGVREDRVFQLAENDHFWQEWRFGTPGPVGHGLTVVLSRSSKQVESIEQLIVEDDQFLELLNLIHVHSESLASGEVVPIANPGFELGIGIERLAAALQGCNSYLIDSIRPLVQTAEESLLAQGGVDNTPIARVCADHFRAICVLSLGGLNPSNKGHGYVLRKLVRRFVGTIWAHIGEITTTKTLVEDLSQTLATHGCLTGIHECADVVDRIVQEEQALSRVLKRAKQHVLRYPNTSTYVLHDTYGVPEKLAPLLLKGGEL
ncbi:hypothetical protein KKH05_02030 [Patescibacteria group bacterium]|nr:hypothetical protein [Patescibacteria group bacterium]